MANEVVKYHNDLNTVPMRNWTREEMNFFFAIIAKLRDKGTREVVFDKYGLAEIANYSVTHNKRFEDTIENLVKKISQIHYIEKKKRSLKLMNLFSLFEVEWEEDLSDMMLKVKVTDEFQYVINKLQVEFTSWELEEFTRIRSTYAKTMYRLLKQWRTIGRLEFKTEMFKKLLDMPDYYGPSHIDKNILKPVLEELPQFFEGLKVKKIKSNKKGTPVIAYEFTWKPETTGKFEDFPQKKQVKSSKSPIPDWLGKESDNEELTDEDKERKAVLEKELRTFWKDDTESKNQTTLDDYGV